MIESPCMYPCLIVVTVTPITVPFKSLDRIYFTNTQSAFYSSNIIAVLFIYVFSFYKLLLIFFFFLGSVLILRKHVKELI